MRPGSHGSSRNPLVVLDLNGSGRPRLAAPPASGRRGGITTPLARDPLGTRLACHADDAAADLSRLRAALAALFAPIFGDVHGVLLLRIAIQPRRLARVQAGRL